VLHQARGLFDRLEAMPALAETDALLAQATALPDRVGSCSHS
jgi:hypothetical protein